MKFPATQLKKSIFPYVTFLGDMKLQDLHLRRYWQYITVLEDALRNNVAPVAMEKPNPSSFDDAKNMFSKMLSEAATANITDKEFRELCKMHLKQSTHMETLSTKMEELQDLFIKKFDKTALPPIYTDTEDLAFEETIGQEMDEYNKMYKSLITELPGLNISNAADASVDFLLKRFFKLDEAIIRRVLDEWVAFKRELDLAMEKYDFIVYLLDNKSNLIFKGDCEGLANVVRSDKELLAKYHRKEAVLELLENWNYYKAKGALKKQVKSFKERIQQRKDHQYKARMITWGNEAVRKKFFLSTNLRGVDMHELWNEIKNEEASLCPIPEGLEMVDHNVSSSATPKGLQLILEP